MEFALVGLTAHGKLMRISGSSKAVDGPSQGVRTAERTGIGTAAGAAIGAITGHLFHHAGTGARPVRVQGEPPAHLLHTRRQ